MMSYYDTKLSSTPGRDYALQSKVLSSELIHEDDELRAFIWEHPRRRPSAIGRKEVIVMPYILLCEIHPSIWECCFPRCRIRAWHEIHLQMRDMWVRALVWYENVVRLEKPSNVKVWCQGNQVHTQYEWTRNSKRLMIMNRMLGVLCGRPFSPIFGDMS